MKKTLCLALLLFQCIATLYAVQAKPGVTKMYQPDGYLLSTLQKGDETFHFRTTTDQYVLLQDAQGYLTYARANSDGELVASGIRAHNVDDRGKEEIVFLQTIKPNLSFGASVKQNVKARVAQKIAQISRIRAAKASASTSPHYLVLLVSFSDNDFDAADDSIRFCDQLNGAAYTTDGATGSAQQYFSDNSMGKFVPTFDVYGPVKLSKTMAYYGGNDAKGNDLHPEEMISEACTLLDKEIDFSKYSTDGNVVDNVFVIYAGYGEASSGDVNTIWPHKGTISANVLLDNVWLDGYGCTNELQASGSIDGIGTMCHEFTHVIGLPDFYDTDYATNGQAYGTGVWDLMGGGNYNNYSMTPPYYTAIEREMMGWGTATELTSAGTYTLAPVNTNQYFKVNTPTANEYYLFENRQQSGWDAYVPGHGMLVCHVDKTAAYQTYWDNNVINAYSAHPCMEIVPAGNTFGNGYEGSQPFPGTYSMVRIADTTTPNLNSWAGVALGKSFVNIAEAGNQVSFLLQNDADVLAVEASAASNINTTSFTANWTVNNSTSTLLNVYQKDAEIAAPTQDFTAGIPTSPWTSSGVKLSTATFATNSARFYNNDAYLISGGYADAINKISFAITTYNAQDVCNSTLELWASTDKSSWDLLKTSSSNVYEVVVTVPVDAAKNYRYFKMVLKKVDTDICVDDINVTYGGVKTYALQNQNVAGAMTYNVTGLNSGQLYYYTLSAANANEALTSNEIAVQLGTVTGNSIASNENFSVYASNRTIIVNLPDAAIVKIYNSVGQLIANKQLQSGTTQIPVSAPGMYIVKTEGSAAKLIVR